MQRFAWVLLACTAACGTTTDDRAPDGKLITAAILAPTCGKTECHSSFAQASDYVFDTYEAARKTIVNNGLVDLNSDEYDPLDPEDSGLVVWLTKNDPLGRGIGRMPLDAPMPFEDIKYLEDWIAAGAKGMQCNPARFGGMACVDTKLYSCGDDWNVIESTAVQCPGDCIQGACK